MPAGRQALSRHSRPARGQDGQNGLQLKTAFNKYYK